MDPTLPSGHTGTPSLPPPIRPLQSTSYHQPPSSFSFLSSTLAQMQPRASGSTQHTAASHATRVQHSPLSASHHSPPPPQSRRVSAAGSLVHQAPQQTHLGRPSSAPTVPVPGSSHDRPGQSRDPHATVTHKDAIAPAFMRFMHDAGLRLKQQQQQQQQQQASQSRHNFETSGSASHHVSLPKPASSSFSLTNGGSTGAGRHNTTQYPQQTDRRESHSAGNAQSASAFRRPSSGYMHAGSLQSVAHERSPSGPSQRHNVIPDPSGSTQIVGLARGSSTVGLQAPAAPNAATPALSSGPSHSAAATRSQPAVSIMDQASPSPAGPMSLEDLIQGRVLKVIQPINQTATNAYARLQVSLRHATDAAMHEILAQTYAVVHSELSAANAVIHAVDQRAQQELLEANAQRAKAVEAMEKERKRADDAVAALRTMREHMKICATEWKRIMEERGRMAARIRELEDGLSAGTAHASPSRSDQIQAGSPQAGEALQQSLDQTMQLQLTNAYREAESHKAAREEAEREAMRLRQLLAAFSSSGNIQPASEDITESPSASEPPSPELQRPHDVHEHLSAELQQPSPVTLPTGVGAQSDQTSLADVNTAVPSPPSSIVPSAATPSFFMAVNDATPSSPTRSPALATVPAPDPAPPSSPAPTLVSAPAPAPTHPAVPPSPTIIMHSSLSEVIDLTIDSPPFSPFVPLESLPVLQPVTKVEDNTDSLQLDNGERLTTDVRPFKRRRTRSLDESNAISAMEPSAPSAPVNPRLIEAEINAQAHSPDHQPALSERNTELVAHHITEEPTVRSDPVALPGQRPDVSMITAEDLDPERVHLLRQPLDEGNPLQPKPEPEEIRLPHGRKLQVSHLLVLYQSMGRRQYCRMCQHLRNEDPDAPDTWFDADAPWATLIDHAESIHFDACDMLSQMTKEDVDQLRRELDTVL